MVNANSRIRINTMRINRLLRAQIQALEMTAEALHTEVIQSQVMPFDSGFMQNESTWVDYSNSSKGKVSIVTSTPYARRLYFHPEYNFQTYENAFAGGKWYEPWLKGGANEKFCREAYRKFFRSLGGFI